MKIRTSPKPAPIAITSQRAAAARARLATESSGGDLKSARDTNGAHSKDDVHFPGVAGTLKPAAVLVHMPGQFAGYGSGIFSELPSGGPSCSVRLRIGWARSVKGTKDSFRQRKLYYHTRRTRLVGAPIRR